MRTKVNHKTAFKILKLHTYIACSHVAVMLAYYTILLDVQMRTKLSYCLRTAI